MAWNTSLKFFCFCGVTVELKSQVPDAVRIFLDRLGFHQIQETKNPDIRFEILDAKSNDIPVSPLTILKQFHWIRSRPCWGEIQNNTLRLTDGSSLTLASYENRKIQIFLKPKTLEDEYFFARTFMPLPLLEILRCFGVFYVHGALLQKKDIGLLILGRGGSGKSTFSAALIKAGWKLVSDDNLLFKTEADGCPRGYPFETEVSLPPHALKQLGWRPSFRLEKKRYRIPRNKIPFHMLSDSVSPSNLLLLTKEEALQIQRSDIFRFLIEENPTFLLHPTLRQNHLVFLEKLLHKVQTSSLTLNWRQGYKLSELYDLTFPNLQR